MRSKGRERGKRTSPVGYAILAAIVLSAIVYSVMFTIGPSTYGDDVTYLSLATQALSGTFHQTAYIFSVRPLMVYPIAFFYWAMGINILSGTLWDIACYAGSIVIAFYIGKELYGERAGLLASFLMLFFPLTAVLGVTVSDDIPMMLLASALMLAILYAERRTSRWWYLAAGALLLAPVLTTPEGAIIIPVALAYLLVEVLRRKIRIDGTSMHFVYGVAAALLLLLLFNQLDSGNALITFTVNSQFFSEIGATSASTGQYTTIPGANQGLWLYPQWMFPYDLGGVAAWTAQPSGWTALLGQLLYVNMSNYVGFFFYAALIASAYLVYRRERGAYFALFWLAAGLLYLEFGPMHFGIVPFQYVLIHRLQRFLTLIAVPTALVIAIGIARFSRGKGRIALAKYGVSAAIILFLLATSAQVIMLQQQASGLARYDAYAIAEYLKGLPSTAQVYMPMAYSQMFSNIPVYMGFYNMSRFHALEGVASCASVPPGSYVVLTKYAHIPGMNYTPGPPPGCPRWETALYPEAPGSYPDSVTGLAYYSRAVLYYVPPNGSTNSTG